jgi:hypothetical protein
MDGETSGNAKPFWRSWVSTPRGGRRVIPSVGRRGSLPVDCGAAIGGGNLSQNHPTTSLTQGGQVPALTAAWPFLFGS